MKKTVFVALGANLGKREVAISQALKALKPFAIGKSFCASSFYETPSVGAPGPLYLNAVCRFDSKLSEEALHAILMNLEKAAGRKRFVVNEPRPLDLDFLFWGSEVVSTPDLQIPHPRLHTRAFVLVPLNEIAPDWVHPILSQSVKQMLAQLPESDLTGIRKI